MKVVVVKYTPNWIKKFEAESAKLQNQIGSIINNIYHIGSTSVPNLMAKPIIDILLDVKNLSQLDGKNSIWENLGYEVMGEYGISGRRYFRKGGDHRTHHVHAFKSGDANLLRHIAFRDYLVAHKKVADEYGQLKLDISRRCGNDMAQYCDEKDAFVKHHEALALKWFAHRNLTEI